MSRLPRSRRRAKGLFFTALFVAASLVLPLLNVAAQVTLSAPVVLPGNDGRPPAAGRQEEPQVSKGSDSSLAVWTDGRTALADNGTTGLNTGLDNIGLGTMLDIYAARVGAAGQVIDTTPIIVSQAQNNQHFPRVSWNGQAWLVVWLNVRPRDQYSFTNDLVGARVSAAGQLLDPTPIVIKADVSDDVRPNTVIDDGAGNWVVVWENFLPQEGTSIPRGVFVTRVANDGTVLDPGGRLVYNHHSQFMGNADLARAGDRYLLTFMTFGPPYTVEGVLLDSNFNNLRNGPEQFAGNGLNPRVASNGQTWFVTWADGASGNVQHINATRVSHDGDPLDINSIIVNPNIGTSPAAPQAAWDGSNWFVTYESSYNPATQTYLIGLDVYLTRVSGAGAVLDTNPVVVANTADTETNPSITPGAGGGALVLWQANFARDVYAARVSSSGTLTNSTPVGLGAARQSKQRMASSGSGFLTVFRSDQSNQQRVYAQRLDQNGAPIDAEPFLLSDQTDVDNPSVAWNGSAYLVVWDATGTAGTARQTFSRLVPASGLPTTQTTPPTLVMNGYQPDVAGLNGNFLVTNILPETAQIRTVQSVRVDGAGTPLGTPVKIERLFDAWPRAVAFGERWLVIWEGHNNHDDSPGTIRGSFVAQDGTAGAPFVVADLGSDLKPEIAVAGDKALVVWMTSSNIYGRRLNADGTSPDPTGGAPIAGATGNQAEPSVTWDGNQYVVVWSDNRRELFPQQPDGDVFGARVAPTNARVEEFAVADSELPEATPFVIAANGLTVFSYAKFYDGSDPNIASYTAHRITLRASRLPAPEDAGLPTAPAALVAEQVNNGPGTGTVDLRWIDASTNETGFKVEMASTGAFNQIRLLGANTTTTGGISVGANTANGFRVRAYNAAGDSPYTNVATPPVASISDTTSSIYAGQNANISVSASDAEGVALVEFYASRDQLNGSTADPPILIGVAATPGTDGKYHLNWVLPPAGYYHVNARVTDATGSSTLTYASTLVVWQKATVTITNPAGGAVFKQPTNITLTAAAQTNNGRSDEYIERLDFYDGTRWIGQGTNTAWQAPWSFVWQNAPAGTHNITAQASSTLTGLAISAPVVAVVNPEKEPEPDPNIKPVVVLTAPVPLTNFTAGAPVPAAATATDADGTINRVEFRANGFTVEVDTTEPYAANLNLPGGTHDITAVAFDNSGGSTVSLPARINIDRTPGPQLTSATPDNQSIIGESVVRLTGAPIDKELADDFDLVGDIDRVVVQGSDGGAVSTVRGAYVRFYAWQNGNPGALQDEQYVPAGDPALAFSGNGASIVDVRLPHSFRASGKHFVSVQLAVDSPGTWYWQSARTGAPQNSAVRTRDKYTASPAWGPVVEVTGTVNADAVMQLYGSLITPASLTSVAPQTVERSGWFVLTGTNFGATQGASRVLVDKLSAIVVKWSPTEIIGYVPEGASLGAVEVVVSNPLGTSDALELNVTERKSVGRIRWQAKYLGDYVTYRPAVAPGGSPDAGSVYLEVDGLVYAWSPTGALKWVARPGGYLGSLSIGGGQISAGPEGNVYVGELFQPAGPGTPFRMAVTALDGKTGAVKWRNIDATATKLYAGPQVGPDGKVYAVFAPGQYNTVAFNPNGTLAWTRDDHLNAFLSGPAREMAFGRTLPRFYFSGGTPLIASDFAGALLWSVNNGTADKPAVGADENLRIRNSSLSAQTGATLYSFAGFGQGPTYPAAAGLDNTHYIINNYYRLYALNPNGTEKWHYDEHDFNNNFGWLSDPNASPSDSFVLMGARNTGNSMWLTCNYGYFVAVDPATGQMAWRQAIPQERDLASPEDINRGQISVFPRMAFTADGSTAYTAGDVGGEGDSRFQGTRYGYFYSLNTSKENVVINQPPTVTLLSPAPNSNAPLGSTIHVVAAVQDDGVIDRVEFYCTNGGLKRIATLTAPDANGQYTTDYTPATAGGYGFFAVAYDKGELQGDTALHTVLISNAAPTVTWVSPTSGAVIAPPPASLTLKVHGTDRDGTVVKAEFYTSATGHLADDLSPDANGDFEVEWANPPAGEHTLNAFITDDGGSRASRSITITINATATPTPTPVTTPTPTPVGQPPVVSITSPADGTAAAPGTNVNVTATASDPDGIVARVDFYQVNGSFDSLISTDFNAPYTATISSFSPTIYDLVAIATDNTGNKTRSGVVRVFFQYPDTDPQGQLTISGRIRHQQSAPDHEIFLPNAVVRLNLNNSFLKATRTDAQGNFIFNSLSYGGRYELKPAEPGYEFFPPSVTFEGLTKNETWDFVAAGPLPPGATPTPTPGSGALTWERFYDGPQHLADYDPRVAVDGQGNSYVAATSGSANGGDTDITLVKYSPAGDLLWSTSYVGEGNYKDWASDVKIDSAGNIYVVGTSWAAAFPGSEYDIVTLKYNAAGQRQWARVYNGPIGHWDLGYALAIDSAGNIAVAGSSQASKPTGALFDEFVTVKYDAAGNELWARRHSTQQIGDDAYSLAVDASNNVYVSGSGYSQTGGTSSRDIITVKYDAAGAKQWASRFTGVPETPGPLPLPNNPVSNESGGIGLDPSGNVYVFGANNADTTESDYLLLKYNPATGALVWGRNWSGQSNDYPRDMVIDQSGNIYLTGESWDGDYQQATSENTWDAATVKFDGAGTLQWARIYRGFPGKVDGGRELALDSAGNIYVGGYSEGFVNGDTVVIKYKPDGTEQWVYRYDNPEHTNDSLGDMTSDTSGNLYLAGQAVLTNASGQETADLVTVKLAASTAQLNDPPEVSLIVGPTIAGQPESFDGNRTGSGSDTVGGPDGPTIAGRSVALNANASDTDGTVASVSFYDNGTLLGTTTAAPYTYQWNDAALGTHAVSATATDNHGATRTSATVTVTFTDTQPTPTPTPVSTPTPTPTPTPVTTPTPNPTPTPVPGMVRVSGRVLDKNFGTGAPGLSVTLSGDATATTQTDAQGRYSFANLPTGGAYTVMVTAPGWLASPHARTFLDCRSDKAADFEVAPESDDIPSPEPIINFVEVPGDPCANNGCDPAPSLGAPANLLDGSTYFVAHHYLDFLGRGPDTSGLNFWKSEVDGCGTDAQCREVKRINVSAAFFLSIEFQETGYLVYRMGLASYGEAPRYGRLMSDSRTIATGVQVGHGDWEARLTQNRRTFADAWVNRAEFKSKYAVMTEEQYVSALLSNAKLDTAGGAALVAALKAGRLTRAEVLLRVADDAELRRKEKSRAFVRMQYYGYLRRDPDAEGYEYWLTKLDGFNGDFIQAEMVKAFLDSAEYRRRFERR